MNVRFHFPVLTRYPGLVYFDSASTTLVPQVAIDAATEFLSNTGSSSRRGAHMLAVQGGQIVEEARKGLADFVSMDSSQVTFQKSISSAIASFALGYDWKKEGKDTILVAESEEHSTLVALQRVSQLLGFEIKSIPIDDYGVLDLGIFDNMINDRVGIVAVGSTTVGWGIKNPLQDIADTTHNHGGVLLSDLSRSFGYDIQKLLKSGPDIAISSANTSFFAPPGLTLQYIDESLGAKHIPGVLGSSTVSNVYMTSHDIALQPDKFESDTLNIPAIAGLSASIDYLLGFDVTEIQSHFKTLAKHTLKRLNQIEGLLLFGHSDDTSMLFGFNLGDEDMISCHDVSLFLDESNIATRSGLLCAHPLVKKAASEGIIQVSYSLYNTTEEIDLLADTLEVISKDLI